MSCRTQSCIEGTKSKTRLIKIWFNKKIKSLLNKVSNYIKYIKLYKISLFTFLTSLSLFLSYSYSVKYSYIKKKLSLWNYSVISKRLENAQLIRDSTRNWRSIWDDLEKYLFPSESKACTMLHVVHYSCISHSWRASMRYTARSCVFASRSGKHVAKFRNINVIDTSVTPSVREIQLNLIRVSPICWNICSNYHLFPRTFFLFI